MRPVFGVHIILLYLGLATLYFGEFDVLFQYPSVYDPTNFREEPIFIIC